jgi:hypothetical protein
MADDLTQIQEDGGQAYERGRERSLQQRRAPGQAPGYQLVKCLGEGAYGEGWLATQQSNPAHRVAFKFYTRRGGDWSSLACEVEKLNILTTDHYIVQLLDVRWDANPPYYVTEYLAAGWSEAYELLRKMPPEDRVKDSLATYMVQRKWVAPPDWNGVIVLSDKR